MEVLVVGNTYLDEFVDLPCFPTPDGKFAVREIVEDLGGSATNACCGFLACGAAARLHSLIGDDDVALRLLDRLRHKGLDLALCKQIQGGKTGRTIVLLTPDGMSTKLGHGGVANELVHHLVPVDQLRRFDHVHLASVSLPLLEKVLLMKHVDTHSPSSSPPPSPPSSSSSSAMSSPSTHQLPPSPSLIEFVPSPSPSADSVDSLYASQGGLVPLASPLASFLPHVTPFSAPASSSTTIPSSSSSSSSSPSFSSAQTSASTSSPPPPPPSSSTPDGLRGEECFPTLSIDLGASILSEDPRRLRAAFKRLDCVFFNEHSLKLVYGVDTDAAHGQPPAWVVALQRELHGTGAKYVVTLGLHGAHAISAHTSCFRPSILTSVVDTTGAGDTFASAFVSFSRLWGDSDSDALEKAHCAAAMKIQHKGGANGHPTREVIEAEWRRRKAAGAWIP